MVLSSIEMRDTAITRSTSASGAAMALNTAVLRAFDSEIREHEALNRGGGIYAVESTVELTGCVVEQITAEQDGGCMYAFSSTLKLDTTDMNECRGLKGGAIYGIACPSVETSYSTFSHNSAVTGGAVNLESSNFADTQSSFDHNSAVGSGGAISLDGESTFSAVDTYLSYNEVSWIYILPMQTRNWCGSPRWTVPVSFFLFIYF